MKIKLELNSINHYSSYQLDPGEQVKIGRGQDNNWIIKDHKVSSYHCMFIYKKDCLEIIDLNSKNGTFLNGIRIETSDFFIGDQLKIGDSIIWLKKENVHPDAVNYLTFPGPHKKYNSEVLVKNFATAKVSDEISSMINRERIRGFEEIKSSRKNELKENTNSYLSSKSIIRKKYRFKSGIATILDSLLFAMVSFIIFYIYRFIMPFVTDGIIQTILFLLIQISALYTLFYFNFKYFSYSLGEKISGIQKLCSKNQKI